MSMRGDVVRAVLHKAVKYNMSIDDATTLINEIFDSLEWDDFCTPELIAKHIDYMHKNGYLRDIPDADYLNFRAKNNLQN